MAAPKGNKYTQVWSDEDALIAFEKALLYAQLNDDCLCMQDAVFESGMPSTTFYRFVEKGEVWESIKKDINSAIVRRVNRGSIQNRYNATASIWRMKQLGEADESSINIQATDTWLKAFQKNS